MLKNRDRAYIIAFFFFVFVFAFPLSSQAGGLIFTLVHSEEGKSVYWWADGVSGAPELTQLARELESMGQTLVYPQEVKNPPRISPVIYGRVELSATNARNLAALYGARHVLNGGLKWECEESQAGVLCVLAGRLSLLTLGTRGESAGTYDFALRDSGFGKDVSEAKANAMKIAALSIHYATASRTKEEAAARVYPELLLIFRGLNAADLIVEIRRSLKGIAGIVDVSERIAGTGMIGIEINPGQTDADEAVRRFAEAFLSNPPQGKQYRYIRESAQGVELEFISAY